jgi:tRNA threonylcarbamoyl adenosine modification protein (Sua5/YciO/YrdC/YwlC family)
MSKLEINASNPEEKKLKIAAEILSSNKLLICPTDSYYAIVCLLSNKNGIEQICKIVGKKPEKANLSILCFSLKNISDFTLQFSKSIYKILNKNLPGPYTFIMRANNKVPKLFLNKKKTIGIRVTSNKITEKLIEMVNEPLVCSSIPLNEESEYEHHIDEILAFYSNKVELIIDGGDCPNKGSAVIDCTGEEPELIREGYLPLII